MMAGTYFILALVAGYVIGFMHQWYRYRTMVREVERTIGETFAALNRPRP